MKVRFYNIDWDIDPSEENHLPEEVTLPVNKTVDLEMTGADILSDAFGFCVNEFQYEVLK